MTGPQVRDATRRRSDDMHDTFDELAALDGTPALRWALETLGAELAAHFDVADRKALEHQRSYRRITWWATTFGTISILLSIAGFVAGILAAVGWSEAILIAQSVALAITAAAVLRGLFAYRHENWLLERCRAEQLRALKFAHLIDPGWWSADARDRQSWLERVRAGADRARALRYPDIISIAGQEDVPDLRPTRLPETDSLNALVSYYERKRLAPQRQYFLDASRDSHRLGARALPLFFFAAVALEGVQVIVTLVGTGQSPSPPVAATWLAASALALPVIWAGIRTQQGAREGSRNAVRSAARHNALTKVSERMAAARNNPVEMLWTMRLAEFVLQVDQREWLRLLLEAEWYG